MSAAVCGSKRTFFEEIPSSPSASVSKKLRRCSPSSASPIRFSPSSLVDHLLSRFPHMDPQLLEKTLLECGNDIDAAIKRLEELCLGSAEAKPVYSEDLVSNVEQQAYRGRKFIVYENFAGTLTDEQDAAAADVGQSPLALGSLPADGAEWVDLFVREMMSAISVDDAKVRASRLLEILEKSISKRAGEEVMQNFHKENVMLKEQIEALIRENSILKRAVAIQHERQKEFEEKNQEVQNLKQLIIQYQEQLRTLEVNNYALAMHLKQAQQNNSMPGRFHPDIF